MQAKLTIQILGRNGRSHLERAVEALRKIPREEAVIRYIDNASTDGSVEFVKQALPHADVLERNVNAGFAGGHNFGLSLCRTPLVLIQDQDVVVDWDGVKELLTAFVDPHVGAVQGKLYRKSQTPSASWRTNDQVLDSTGIVQTITLNGRERGAGENDHGQFDRPSALLAVTGGCALYRMEALQTVAHGEAEFFDADFFAYKEDVDLGWRLNKAGWKCVYVPIRMGWHARTVKREGILNWGLNPKQVIARLKNPRSRMSLRNYCWMIMKNARGGEMILHAPFIFGRLLIFWGLGVIYWPFLTVWLQVARGLSAALAKRA